MVGILFLIGIAMILVGMFGRAGTGTVAEIDANVAATLGLLVTFGFLLMNFSTASELAKIFEGICGGIPFLSEIADYGSLRSVMHEAPLKAAMAFFDVVFLSTIINLLSLLPLTSGSATGKFMVKIFTGMVLALVSLMILNFVVKESETYRYLTACLGALIAITSLGSIPIFIISIIKANSYSGLGFIGMLFLFSKSRFVGIFRDSFFKAMVYVAGIHILETKYGSIADAMSLVSSLVIAFGPAVITIIGMVIMLSSMFKK